MKRENTECPEAKHKLTVRYLSSSRSESLQTQLKNIKQKSQCKQVLKIPLTALGPGLEKKTTQVQRMFMRLNVLDLFTAPLRLCRLSSPCSGGVERLLWAWWGISEAKHIFYSENFLPWSFSRRDQVSNSPFLQSDTGMIISPQYQNKKVPQPRLDAILLVIQPKLCKICGCECSNQKRRGRRQVRGEREAQRDSVLLEELL